MTSENTGKTKLISCGKNWQEKYQGRIQEPKSRAGGQEWYSKKYTHVLFGRGKNAEIACNSKMLRTDRPTDRPTDRHGKFLSRVSATKNGLKSFTFLRYHGYQVAVTILNCIIKKNIETNIAN